MSIHTPNDNYPLTKFSENVYIEGYWFNKQNMYPMPLPSDTNVDEKFLARLKQYMMDVDLAKNNFDYHNRSHIVIFKGQSTCRLCNVKNGDSEYYFNKQNMWFRVPSGLCHYYEVHKVQPSNEFFDFIMSDTKLILSTI